MEAPQEKISITQMLALPMGKKRFFQVEIKQESESELQEQVDVKKTFEIQIQPRSFDGVSCQLMVVRDVSHVL